MTSRDESRLTSRRGRRPARRAPGDGLRLRQPRRPDQPLGRPAGRGSTFDRAEVEALLAGSGGDGARAPRPSTWRGPVVDTDITLIEDGRLFLRGVDAVELAAGRRLRAGGAVAVDRRAGAHPLRRAGRTARRGPCRGRRAAAVGRPDGAAAGRRRRGRPAADPLRYDVRGAAVLHTAQGLLATMVAGPPRRSATRRRPRDGGPLARRLWARLSAPHADRPAAAAAWTPRSSLLMDHDLAVSTVAVRTAASVRAHPYAVVATGLAAMEGPLHGAASTLARDVLHGLPGRATRGWSWPTTCAPGGRCPASATRLYPDGDPRGRDAARPAGRRARRGRGRRRRSSSSAAAAASSPTSTWRWPRWRAPPGCRATRGEVVFCVARSVGWVAHALEEYDETPLRFRGQGATAGRGHRSRFRRTATAGAGD